MVQGQPLFQSDVKKQADTPEFKKWFGDSKVVDENGGPLVVFTEEKARFLNLAVNL